MNNAIDYMATARRQAQDDWHQRQVDADAVVEQARESWWTANADQMTTDLLNGETFKSRDGNILIAPDDAHCHMFRCAQDLVDYAIEISAEQPRLSGQILAEAQRYAAKDLLRSQIDELWQAAIQSPDDESFFKHIGGVA